jgi:hypothetical protein
MCVQTEQYKGYLIDIEYDQCPESPRTWAPLGTLVNFHPRYNIGDDGYNIPADRGDGIEFRLRTIPKIRRAGGIVLPVYMIDHSGISISVAAYGCRWDSGIVGYIFIERSKILAEYKVKRVSKQLRERVTKYLIGEVETMDAYLRGEVYGYVLKDRELNEIDAVWSYYDIEHAIQDARAMVDATERHRLKEHSDKLKRMIRSNVPFEYRPVWNA